MSDMTTVNRRSTVNLTDEQMAILRQLSEQAGFKSLSAYIKSIIEKEAFHQGYLWPEDANEWGDIKRIKGDE